VGQNPFISALSALPYTTGNQLSLVTLNYIAAEAELDNYLTCSPPVDTIINTLGKGTGNQLNIYLTYYLKTLGQHYLIPKLQYPT
jgi:hypothetical protein